MAAEDGGVYLQLGGHGLLNRELGGRLFIELFPQAAAQFIVIAQGGQIVAQGLPVAGLEEIAVHVLVDEIGDASHGGGDGSQMEPGPLRQGIREGLGQAGEGVDVQGAVKPVHAAGDPSGEAHLPLYAQLCRQGGELVLLRPVAGDQQPQSGALGVARGEAPHQSGHVLHRIHPGGDAYHHRVLVHICAQAPQVLQPVPLGGRGREVDAVIDGVEPVRREATGDQQVHHGVGHADPVIQPPQGQGVDGAEGQMAEGAAHVVQAVVAVDGGHHRQSRDLAEHGADHVGPGAMAVDDLVAALPDIGRQLPPGAEDVVAPADHGGNAHLAGLLGKGAVPEAHQLGGDGLIQMLQQAQHMGFCAAGVSAADEMNDLHGMPFFPLSANRGCEIARNIIQYEPDIVQTTNAKYRRVRAFYGGDHGTESKTRWKVQHHRHHRRDFDRGGGGFWSLEAAGQQRRHRRRGRRHGEGDLCG